MNQCDQIALLEEQKDEAAEQVEDDAKPSEGDIVTTDLNSKADDIDEKPDINDVPMEENEVRRNTFCSLIFIRHNSCFNTPAALRLILAI